MEMKAGYKQSEVGVIPEEWEVKTLEELGSIGSGGTPNSMSSIIRGRSKNDQQ